jgi:hypothetical protein
MGASYPSDKKIHQGHQSSNDRFWRKAVVHTQDIVLDKE